jgi:hypothetical protein
MMLGAGVVEVVGEGVVEELVLGSGVVEFVRKGVSDVCGVGHSPFSRQHVL